MAVALLSACAEPGSGKFYPLNAGMSLPNPTEAVSLNWAAPLSAPAGTCQPVTIEVLQRLDTLAELTESVSIVFTSNAVDGRVYTDSVCSNATSLVTINPGSASQALYIRKLSAGALQLTASSGALRNGTHSMTWSAAAVLDALAMSGTSPADAGDCIPITVVTQSGGVTAVATSLLTVGLNDASAGGTFYSDSSCLSSTPNVDFIAGDSSKTVYYKRVTGGSVTLHATSAPLAAASFPLLLNATGPTKLVVTGPSPITSYSCNAYAITSQDAASAPLAVLANTSITLSGAGPGGAFYSDAACSVSTSSAMIAASSSSTIFYYKKISSGSVTLQASSAPLTDGTLPVVVDPASPTHVVLTGPNSILTTACAPYSLQLNEGGGNPTQATVTTTVGLSDASTGQFFSDAGCATLITSVDIAAGSGTQSFYYRRVTPGTVTLTASSIGLTSGTQSVTISVDVPALIALTGNATQTAVACSAVTVTLKDAAGNVSPAGSTITVLLGGEGVNGSFYTAAGCAMSTTTVDVLAAAFSATVYYKKTSPGAVTLSADSSGLSSGALAVNVIPSTPAKLSISDPGTSPATTDCTMLTVSTLDASDNPVNVTGATTINLGGAGTGGAFHSNPTCSASVTTRIIAAATGSVSYYYKKTSPGAVTLTAAKSGMLSGSRPLTIVAGAASKLAFTTPNATAQNAANYTCRQMIVTSRDDNNNTSVISAGAALTLDGHGTGGYYTTNACTIPIASPAIPALGSSYTYYFKATAPGAVTLTADSPGMTQGTRIINVSSGIQEKLAYNGGSTAGKKNQCLSFPVVFQDESNANVNSGIARTVTFSDGTANNYFYTNNVCTVSGNTLSFAPANPSKTMYYKTPTEGTVTITASDGLLTDATRSVSISSGEAKKLVWITASGASPTTGSAGYCSTNPYQLQQQDEGNQTVAATVNTQVDLTGAGGDGAFYSDPACASSITQVQISSGSTNSANYYYKKATPGSVTLSADLTGLTSAPNRTVTIAATPTKLVFTAGATSTTVGTCGAYTIQSQDAASVARNVVVTTAIALTGAGAGGEFYLDGGCTLSITATSIAAGSNNTTIYFMRDQTGSSNLDAAASGLTPAAISVSVN